MPRPEHVDLAHLLLRKAAADLAVTRTLAADADPHDEAIGFHAQQAVEKAFPASIAEPEWLSPWAVTTRYDDLDDTLDSHAAIEAADSAIKWAQACFEEVPGRAD